MKLSKWHIVIGPDTYPLEGESTGKPLPLLTDADGSVLVGDTMPPKPIPEKGQKGACENSTARGSQIR